MMASMPPSPTSSSEARDSRSAGAPRRLLLALIGGQLGLHSAMAGARVAAPLQALSLGWGAPAVGALLALFAAAPVLLALHAGRMADRHGYHRPLHVAVAMTTLGGALALLASWLSGAFHAALLGLGALLMGGGSNIGLITVQRTASRSARDQAERVRVFSWLGLAPALSNMIGASAAGVLIDAAGFRGAFAALMLMPLAALACARAVPREAVPPEAVPPAGAAASADRSQAAANGATQAPRHAVANAAAASPAAASPAAANAAADAAAPSLLASAWQLLKLPGIAPLLALNWVLSACWDVHGFAVPILGHERGFSASTIGFVLGVFPLAVSAVRQATPLLASRLQPLRVLLATMLASACVFGVYPLTRTPMAMAACAVALGLALGAVQPMIMSTLHALTPPERHGEAIALRSMAINASSLAMPLLFGALGAALGVAMLFWAMALALLANAWLTRRIDASLLKDEPTGTAGAR